MITLLAHTVIMRKVGRLDDGNGKYAEQDIECCEP